MKNRKNGIQGERLGGELNNLVPTMSICVRVVTEVAKLHGYQTQNSHTDRPHGTSPHLLLFVGVCRGALLCEVSQ